MKIPSNFRDGVKMIHKVIFVVINFLLISLAVIACRFDEEGIGQCQKFEWIHEAFIPGDKTPKQIAHFGISRENASFFLLPYERYNYTIRTRAWKLDRQLINLNLIPGRLCQVDYIILSMAIYLSSEKFTPV
ncbi:hypothetical protein [Flexithrix dorotheae]|uniref:hypothetical protein n=1 Tax=Flexithrix dorotheae TaxID=70993 RepID=UPI00036E59EC|nr:hypothetical protein [Flexithrix dorotheae]